MASPYEKMTKFAQDYAEKHDTDFAVYFGDMTRQGNDWLIDACQERRRRTHLLLLLATRGGDASAAYRLGRGFQKIYEIEKRPHEGTGPEFTIFIPTLCKSAGTILATSATKIVMSNFAELGPIDIQLRNPLEVGERTSSLNPIQALQSLKGHAESLFVDQFKRLRFDDTLTFSTKMAAEIASGLTVGLLSPIYAQVDPIRLAEVERSLRVSGDYTERLTSLNASNLQDGAVERLLGAYPSHGFVIDAKEARELFKRVEEPEDSGLSELASGEYRHFFDWALHREGAAFAEFVSKEPELKDEDDGEHTGEGTGTTVESAAEVREDENPAAETTTVDREDASSVAGTTGASPGPSQ